MCTLGRDFIASVDVHCTVQVYSTLQCTTVCSDTRTSSFPLAYFTHIGRKVICENDELKRCFESRNCQVRLEIFSGSCTQENLFSPTNHLCSAFAPHSLQSEGRPHDINNKAFFVVSYSFRHQLLVQ